MQASIKRIMECVEPEEQFTMTTLMSRLSEVGCTTGYASVYNTLKKNRTHGKISMKENAVGIKFYSASKSQHAMLIASCDRVTIQQIADVISIDVEFTTNEVMEKLHDDNVYIDHQSLYTRVRNYVKVGFISKVKDKRRGKSALYTVNAEQYKKLINEKVSIGTYVKSEKRKAKEVKELVNKTTDLDKLLFSTKFF